MSAPRWTPEARDNLLAIVSYLAEQSRSAATRVLDRIEREVAFLAENPRAGHFRPELLANDYRFWSVYSYLIVYRWRSSPIEVIAVVHGARDLIDYFDAKRGEP